MQALNNRVGICEKRKRVGRGGSRGGTSGRGSKGQKSRAGAGRKLSPGFEGGQMPLHRRLPKVGFNNTRFKKVFSLVNIEQLERLFTDGEHINKAVLMEKGIVRSNKELVKILGQGSLSKKLVLTVDACSKTALAMITSCGGEVHFTKEA